MGTLTLGFGGAFAWFVFFREVAGALEIVVAPEVMELEV